MEKHSGRMGVSSHSIPDQEGKKIPRYNLYVCQHGCHTITVDVDHGVTPFMIPCQRKSDASRPLDPKLTNEHGVCTGFAKSSFYPTRNIPDDIVATHEWFKANEKDEQLTLRPRTDRTPIYHGEEPVEKVTIIDEPNDPAFNLAHALRFAKAKGKKPEGEAVVGYEMKYRNFVQFQCPMCDKETGFELRKKPQPLSASIQRGHCQFCKVLIQVKVVQNRTFERKHYPIVDIEYVRVL